MLRVRRQPRIKLLGDIGDDQFITKMIDGSRAALRDLRNREPWVHYINRSYFLAYDGNELVGATYDLIKFLDTYPTYQGGKFGLKQDMCRVGSVRKLWL